MEANELRIGNYVYCNFTTNQPDKIYKINCVDFDIINTKDGNMENYKPIPLTEDILLECGFEFDGLFYSKGKFVLGNIDNYYFLCIDRSTPFKHFQYIHQLQNLYFALTGNELTVTL